MLPLAAAPERPPAPPDLVCRASRPSASVPRGFRRGRAGMPCTVVVGAQWGDEGKGKIVDALSEAADIVARYQGGPNAGHSVIRNGKTVVLHLVPSGIMVPGRRCLIGNGVVIDLARLREEVAGLEALGLDVVSRLGVSPAAH